MRSVTWLLVVATQWEEYILFISLAYIHVPKWIFEVVKHTVYVSTTQYKQRSLTWPHQSGMLFTKFGISQMIMLKSSSCRSWIVIVLEFLGTQFKWISPPENETSKHESYSHTITIEIIEFLLEIANLATKTPEYFPNNEQKLETCIAAASTLILSHTNRHNDNEDRNIEWV